MKHLATIVLGKTPSSFASTVRQNKRTFLHNAMGVSISILTNKLERRRNA